MRNVQRWLAATTAVVGLLVAGCGGGARTTRTVTVTTAASAPALKSDAVPTTAALTGTSSGSRKVRGVSTSARGRVPCDANITVKAGTTSCPFAQNVFYEYWKAQDQGDDAVRAYSPISKETYDMACTAGTTVVCRAGDGGEVRFSSAAVDAYDAAQAARYAATHDTGPENSPSPESDGGNQSGGGRSASAGSGCDSSYEGACLDPDASDYDCEGGSGDGPQYTGTVRVVGDDHYDLDRDGDGIACDT